MKRNSFFLAGVALLALGTTACQNKNVDTPVVPQATSGSTYASMLISTGRSIETRTYTQGDEQGRPTEQKLTTLDFISNRLSKSFTEGAVDTDDMFWMITGTQPTASKQMYKTAPWKVDAGSISFAVIANKATALGTVTIGTASNMVYGSSTSVAKDIENVTKDNNFVMTSKVATGKTITDGKTKDQVKNGSAETDNVFSVDLERIMCQGKVAVNDELKAKLEGDADTKLSKHMVETSDKDGKVQLDDMKYAAVNGAVKTFLFADNSGQRTFDSSNHNYGSAFKSFIHNDLTTFSDAKEASAVTEQLVRLGNFASDQGGYAAKNVLTDKANAKTTAGIYFFENSVNNANLNVANKKFGYYRLAYAKVYAVFYPNVIYKKGEDGKLIVDENYVLGTTFYVGEDSHSFYSSKEAAQADPLNTSTRYYTYTNGKCAYRALWNRDVDTDGKTVKNADTRRNNIYLLTISGFKSVGMPWDPSDPQDPNLPKGEDKNEGGDDKVPGGDSSIEKTETYMRVDATILPWNLVEREVTFGNE